MKITTAVSTLFATAFLLVAGCKDNPADASGGNRKDLLVGSWRTTSVTSNGFDVSETYADNTTFKADGSYTSTYPGSSPESGTWLLTSGDTKLIMDENGASGTWDIIELTSTNLHLKSNLVVLGQTLAVDLTAVRQ